MPSRIDATHIEDVKNPIEVLAPSRNRIFVGFHIGEPRDRSSFTLADNLPLDLGHSPVIEILIRGAARRTHCWFDLPGQFLDRPEHRRTEILWLPPIQSPVEGFAYGTARQAKVGVVLIVRRRVLRKCGSKVGRSGGRTNPYRSQESSDRAESSLRWGDTTALLC